MSTYKIWQPYQLVSLEIKQSQQPSKKYLTYPMQQQQTKTTKKNKQKEPKLSETIKKYQINIHVQNVNIKFGEYCHPAK